MHPFYFCVCLAHKYRHMLVINIWSEDYEIILPELNPCCQNWRSPEVFLTEVRRRSTSCMQTHWFFAVARCVNHHADNSFLWTFKRLFFFSVRNSDFQHITSVIALITIVMHEDSIQSSHTEDFGVAGGRRFTWSGLICAYEVFFAILDDTSQTVCSHAYDFSFVIKCGSL